MKLADLPDIRHHDTNGYEIALCVYGHPYYWLAGGSRGEHTPPVKVGIWRCVVCYPPLEWVTETKMVEELAASAPANEEITTL